MSMIPEVKQAAAAPEALVPLKSKPIDLGYGAVSAADVLESLATDVPRDLIEAICEKIGYENSSYLSRMNRYGESYFDIGARIINTNEQVAIKVALDVLGEQDLRRLHLRP